jgi:hypothetical protein
MEMAEALHEHGVPLAYGGKVFNEIPNLRNSIRGHFLGEDIAGVADAVEYALLAPPPPRPEPLTADRAATIRHFCERSAAIELDVLQEMQPLAIDDEYVRIALSELRRHIVASLKLCDPEYLGPCLDWTEKLMINRGMSGAVLRGYLERYLDASRRHLDQRGAPLINWLHQRLSGTDAQVSPSGEHDRSEEEAE